MKTIIAVLALLVASCCAAPAPMEKSVDAHEPMLTLPQKGEAPMSEEKGEFWIPFWDFFSNMWSTEKAMPTANNEVRMAKPVNEIKKEPMRAEFDDSDEFLEEVNKFHFGESAESRELVDVDSKEARHANYKTPEHVKDAIVYNKVMPHRGDFDDYGEYLQETSRHMMEPMKAAPKAKSTWGSWFKMW